MSEYIEVTPESCEKPDSMILRTNLALLEINEAKEIYLSPVEMEEGSALAQMFAPIEGINRLEIEDNNIIIWKDEADSWHTIVSEVTAALKEFFL